MRLAARSTSSERHEEHVAGAGEGYVKESALVVELASVFSSARNELLFARRDNYRLRRELSLGIYPLIWGFRHVPIADEYDRDQGFPVRATPEPVPA